MWHDIVQLDVSTVEKLIRPVLIYGFLVVALTLAGKRELAQLNSLDFVVLLAVANAVQNGIIGADDSVTRGVLGASALVVLNRCSRRGAVSEVQAQAPGRRDASDVDQHGRCRPSGPAEGEVDRGPADGRHRDPGRWRPR
jgi:hypothetical protein